MGASSSIFNARDFARRYTKQRRAVVINNGTRIQPAAKLATGWPEVRILIVAGLLICCASLVKMVIGMF